MGKRATAELWVLMAGMFASRWTSQYGESDAEGVWSRALAGLTGEDVARGVARVADSRAEWPPSAPEFRAMCEPTPDLIGAPSVARAYAEACRNAHPVATRVWSHQAVWHAALDVGLQALNRLSESVALPRFERAYMAAVRLVLAGGELTPFPAEDAPALPKLGDPAVGRRHLADLRRLLAGRSAV